MTGKKVLAELKTRGVVLERHGDHLHYRAPKGALTSELRQALIANKFDLLALLNESPDYVATACICPTPIGPTGPDQCRVCELNLICPECSRCRGCKLRLRFPLGSR